VKSDGERFQQVVLNLLSNALKFTFSGSVTISTEMVKSASNHNRMLQCRVKDTG
jgi:signal transduction histidine kinase